MEKDLILKVVKNITIGQYYIGYMIMDSKLLDQYGLVNVNVVEFGISYKAIFRIRLGVQRVPFLSDECHIKNMVSPLVKMEKTVHDFIIYGQVCVQDAITRKVRIINGMELKEFLFVQNGMILVHFINGRLKMVTMIIKQLIENKVMVIIHRKIVNGLRRKSNFKIDHVLVTLPFMELQKH